MPKKIDLTDTFQTAQSAQTGHFKQRVEELEAQIAAIKAQGDEEKAQLQEKLEELALKLAEGGGVHQVDVELIDRNPAQPRQTFPEQELFDFGRKLIEEGQLIPIILIPSGDRYLLFDGERRWRASRLVGLSTLKAVLRYEEQTDQHELRRQTLATTRDRADLHPLDLAHCIVEEIVYQYPEFQNREAEIPAILNAAIKRLERSERAKELKDLVNQPKEDQAQWVDGAELTLEQEQIVLTILNLSYNPQTISKVCFPTLSLPEDIKEIIRETGLDGGKARRLGRLTAAALDCSESMAKKARQSAAKRVVDEGLSERETDALVKEVLRQHKPLPEVKEPPQVVVAKRVKLVEELPTTDVGREELLQLQEALERKLQEIKDAIAQVSMDNA